MLCRRSLLWVAFGCGTKVDVEQLNRVYSAVEGYFGWYRPHAGI